MRSLLCALLVLGTTAIPAPAEVKLNAIFSDHMVLQRDIPVNVWGTAGDGEKVTVGICGQSAEATAAGGTWKVTLKPLSAGGPHTLTVKGSNEITLKDVLVGDVWVCGGQSNMDWDLARLAKAGEMAEAYGKIVKEAGDYPQVRMIVAEKAPIAEKATDLKIIKGYNNSWQVSAPETAPLCSAVGYVFGLRLHQHLKVPIGLIDSNKGGSPVETWMSEAALKEAGCPVAEKRYYNGNIHPLLPFAIKGAIWYQGESNARTVASSIKYGTTFPTMITSWRKEWGQGDFPFLYVQLAAWEGRPTVNTTWPLLRESQDKALALPNVGAALAIDKGCRKNIHPPYKISVSERLVLAARKHAYGEDLVWSGPRYKSHQARGGGIAVTFDHAGDGLQCKGFTMETTEVPGDKVVGFEISADGVKYVPAGAEIKGKDTVVVSSPDVQAPQHVRYAWTGFPSANLFNSEGLPAHAFRTDTNTPPEVPAPAPRKRKPARK